MSLNNEQTIKSYFHTLTNQFSIISSSSDDSYIKYVVVCETTPMRMDWSKPIKKAGVSEGYSDWIVIIKRPCAVLWHTWGARQITIVFGYLVYTIFPYLYIYSENKYLLSHVYLELYYSNMTKYYAVSSNNLVSMESCRSVTVDALTSDIVMSSNSDHSIMFTFAKIPKGSVWTLLFPPSQLWVI